MIDQKQKFLFDRHIFDEEEEEEEIIEDAPPPPPVFSEEELEAAKKQAFEEGRTQGIAESLQSREEKAAKLLEIITGEARSLFDSEQIREKTFESETVRLSSSIFEKLFPLYNKEYGFHDLQRIIADILQKHEGQTKILIEVAPDQKSGIEQYISQLPPIHGGDAQFTVHENTNLADGSCRLSWADGGAIRDIESMAEEIRTIIQDTLAGDATNSHDSISGGDTQEEPIPASESLSDNPSSTARNSETTPPPEGTDQAETITDDMETNHDG